eukprot:TRINITY_DN22779_c0_g1_i1.p1 TRINITY_DN22779_c0_g1~~TRINITY_DN22779_c0_g1_i1.p1  ORF type:complete len:370 (-),score=102.11 TRINITY_DN22779_c0_g1_i1:30-1139(-)
MATLASPAKRQKVGEDQNSLAEGAKSGGELGSFDFCVLRVEEKVPGRVLQTVTAAVLERQRLSSRLAEEGKIAQVRPFEKRLKQYLARIEGLYLPHVAYHNATHAADVVATADWMMQSTFFDGKVDALDRLGVLVAGAVHDVAHPGRNNAFQKNLLTDLAIRYNDQSVLEHMHVSTAFEALLKDEALNWFALLRSAEGNLQQRLRRCLVDCVLGTDMEKHGLHLTFAKALAAETASQELKEEQKTKLLECVVHAADINFACKRRASMLQWTRRLLDEFWEQGDEEQRRGMQVSMLCNRAEELPKVPQGQLGFIRFVLKPFFAPLADILPEMKKATDQLKDTEDFWEEMKEKNEPVTRIFGDEEFGRASE